MRCFDEFILSNDSTESKLPIKTWIVLLALATLLKTIQTVEIMLKINKK
jgi:hypothetical protein